MKPAVQRLILTVTVALLGHSVVKGATIGIPKYSSVADSAPPTYDLTAVGSSDWHMYGASTTTDRSEQNARGNSITMLAPLITAPCTSDNALVSRSSARFSWTGGTPDPTGSSVDPRDNGFSFASADPVGYYANYETLRFVPGDANLHTIHLYGYLNNNNSGISLQFSNSIAGASPVLFTTNSPALGDFDYSVQFRADNPNDALTVVWTFQKTGTTGSAKRMGINAAAMDGQPRGMNWRVIADDPQYPANEAIVAGVVIGDPDFSHPLPANPAAEDCSMTFQEGMNLMSAAGGGTVYVPPGHYMFTNNLTIPDGVILRGRWVMPGSNQPVVGTVLDIYANAGSFTNAGANDDLAFLTGAGSECGVRDLAFWYPLQNATNPVPYPYTMVNKGGMTTIENITLVNTYAGLDLSKCSFECLRGVYGTPLTTGMYIDKGYAVPRFDDVHFSPDYWAWCGLANAPTNAADQKALAAFLLSSTNGIGVDLREVDGAYVQNITVSGYYYGIRLGIGASGDNPGYPQFFNVQATNCQEALRFDSTKGLGAFGCTFGGTTNGIGFHRVQDRGGSFYGCTIYGGAYAVLGDPGSLFYTVSLQGCTLGGLVSVGDQATLQVLGSAFTSTGINIVLNSGVVQAMITSSTNCGPANIVNNSGASANSILIITNPVPVSPLPPFPTSYPKVRKPDKLILFNVTSSGFAGGAKGNGLADDTAPIQAAIAAAEANGGGIVFFPAGQYRVTSPLNVNNGVELRGIFGGRHENNNLGSLLQIAAGAGSSNGTPFITLGDRCGIRGLNLDYPNQNWQLGQQIPYPYMIRCQGMSNYVVDCCAGDIYQGVDLNGARTALVDYCFFGGLLNTYMVRGGATDCRIQNSHIKPQSWWLNTNAPPTGDEPSIIISHNEDVFIAEDCTNLTIFSIFNHESHTLLTLRGGTGQALMLAGEQLQRGFVLETAAAAGTFNFIGCNCNVSSQGDGTGEYCWWLRTNFTGTVSPMAAGISDAGADYDVRVDHPAARFLVNDMSTGQGRGIWNIRAAGEVAINNSSLGERFSLDVPAGGRFSASQSFLPPMPNLSQAGLVGYTNCVINNSFIAADMNETPYRPVGITVQTNNLAPVWVNAWPSAGSSRDPSQRSFIGWHLQSGSNFLFHVTDTNYSNGVRSNVTIDLKYLEDTDGSLTVAYDSKSGMKTGATYTLYSTNAAWTSKTFTVSDARFAGTNGVDIMVTASNADPVIIYALVQSGYLGVPPQLVSPPPVASFSVAPASGIRPLPVTFTDTSTGAITSLLWSFGDGQTTNTAAGARFTHTYPIEGVYSVVLKVSGPGGSGTNIQNGCVTVLIPSPPRITGLSPAGPNALVMQGDGGPTNGGYYYWLRCSTNLALPLNKWSLVATNPLDLNGAFSNQIPVTPGAPQLFYRLQLP